MAGFGFTATAGAEQEEGYRGLPGGKHPFRLVAYKLEEHESDPSGNYYETEFEVFEGPNRGRKHWKRWYLWSSDAEKAAKEQNRLSQYLSAVGIVSADNFEPMMMQPFIGDIFVAPPNDAGKRYSHLTRFSKHKAGGNAGAVPPANTQASTPAPAAPAAPSGGKPKAYKNPDDGKWYDENEVQIPFFKLSAYEKVDG